MTVPRMPGKITSGSNTSEAVGYVDADGDILGWFNELAFAPVDLSESAATDEWSGDAGVGCKYFSQDAVIRLAPAAGIALDESATPAEKLKAVQQLAGAGDPRALAIFRDIGVYLAHTLPLYAAVYDLENLLVLGARSLRSWRRGDRGDLPPRTARGISRAERKGARDAPG